MVEAIDEEQVAQWRHEKTAARGRQGMVAARHPLSAAAAATSWPGAAMPLTRR